MTNKTANLDMEELVIDTSIENGLEDTRELSQLDGISHRVTAVLQERDEADRNIFASLVNLIDVVVQRGAVRGDELLSTGVLRENLVNRIKELETYGYTQ